MPDLSIVIVNYNTREKLRDCLESIVKHTGNLDIETIVVDNGSKDNSAAMIREFAPAVKLVEPGYNTWFTGGNNIGAKTARGEYLWILNPDTVVQPDTMQKMVAYLKEHPEVGAITSLMRFPDGREQPTCSMTPRYLDLLLPTRIGRAAPSAGRSRRPGARWPPGSVDGRILNVGRRGAERSRAS